MRYQDAFNKIKNLILNSELGESGTRLISAQALGAMCGISFVNTLKIIKQLNEELYLVAIGQKYYLANGKAKKRSDLRATIGESKKIGILLSSFTNPFFASVTEKLYIHLQEQGYIPLIQMSRNCGTEKDCLRFFIQNKCEGAILLTPPHVETLKDVYNRYPLPFVIIGNIVKDLNTSYITSENHSTGTLVANHLITKGYNHFVYIHPYNFNQNNDERLQGFLKGVMRSKSIEEIDNNHFSSENSPVFEIKFNAMDTTWKWHLSNYLRSLPQGDKVGIFCYHDLISFETYAYLSNAGFKIPQEIGIIGYDDLDVSRSYKLSTCSYSYNEIVEKALLCLRNKIERDKEPDVFIKVQTILLARESTNYIDNNK